MAPVFLKLHLANIENFEGDYVVTSTNRRLEGIQRRNWWGFAGRSSVDATLHQYYLKSSYLVQESKRALQTLQRQQKQHPDSISSEQSLLPFAACLITPAGPFLPKIRSIVHTCVPRFPPFQESEIDEAAAYKPHNPTTLPHAHVETQDEAMELLQTTYQNILRTVLTDFGKRSSRLHDEHTPRRTLWDWADWLASATPSSASYSHDNDQLRETQDRQTQLLSVCMPAIGCGYNGYPSKLSAKLALDAIIGIEDLVTQRDGDLAVPHPLELWIEIRFREQKTLRDWEEVLQTRIPEYFLRAEADQPPKK